MSYADTFAPQIRTVEEGYELAKHQRPGLIVTMGAKASSERLISPLGWFEEIALANLPWPKNCSTWFEYDQTQCVGRNISYANLTWCRAYHAITGEFASKDLILWLEEPSTSRKQMIDKLDQLIEESAP